MQQEQMVLKKQLAEANEKLALANESSATVATSLPANLTKVNSITSSNYIVYYSNMIVLYTEILFLPLINLLTVWWEVLEGKFYVSRICYSGPLNLYICKSNF